MSIGYLLGSLWIFFLVSLGWLWECLLGFSWVSLEFNLGVFYRVSWGSRASLFVLKMSIDYLWEFLWVVSRVSRAFSLGFSFGKRDCLY